jgi:hypothetical protein
MIGPKVSYLRYEIEIQDADKTNERDQIPTHLCAG